MATEENFQAILFRELAKFMHPVVYATSSDEALEEFMQAIGWDLREMDLSTVGDLQTLFGDFYNVYTSVSGWIQTPPDSLADLIEMLNDTKGLVDAIHDIEGATGTSLFQGFNELGRDILEFLIANYLQLKSPVLFDFLVLLGIIEHRDFVTATDYVFENQSPNYRQVRLPYKGHKLRFDKIKDLINDPNYFNVEFKLPSNGVNWATTQDAIDTAEVLFPRLARLFHSLGLNENFGLRTGLGINFGTTGNLLARQSMMVKINSPDQNSAIGLVFTLSSQQQGGHGIVISPIGTTTFSHSFKNWKIDAKISAAISGFGISPSGFSFPTNFSTGKIGATLDLIKVPKTESAPAILIGSSTGTRLQIGEFTVSGNFDLSSNLREYGLQLELKNAAFFILPGDGDGFIKKILPANGIQGEFDIKLMWDNIAGFHFEGSGGMEVKIPIHKTLLNVLTIDSLTVAAKIDQNVKLITAMSGTLKLGPFTAVFDQIGLAYNFDFPTNMDGNLGALDVNVGFKPPSGLGLSIKNKTISGSGYLAFNKDDGKYIGALELRIQDVINIKAFGILNTKLPGGVPGYALVLVVLTDGFQPIPLGFGFTLNGIGGLIALNRRMDSEFLLNAAMDGRIKNILSPDNPVQNINSIVDTLEHAFPIEEGRFTFGPMLKIGWGSPTLITIDVGIFLEFPDPEEIVILGLIRAILPDENTATIQLQIAFAGVINFEKKFIKFNAALINSRLLGFPLDGQMAFRMYWGDQPNFILSVGGFHPDYKAPAELQGLRRLTMNLVDGDNPRITLTAYFALTSNSVQFGARVDFYYDIASVWPFGHFDVVGYLGFDALIYFNPFHFRINIDAGLSVRCDGDSILSITLRGMLEGPKQWHVQGYFKIEIWGLDWDKDFDWTSGEPDYTTLPDVQVLPKLVTALQDPKNWKANPVTGIPLLVTLRELAVNPGDLVVHPQTSLAVNQKVVPLNTSISRFGNARPVTNTQFNIELSYDQTPGTYLAKNELKEYFSPNEFFELNEGERISRASFEPLPSGAEVSSTSNTITTGDYREMKYLYETIVMDSRNYPIDIPIDEPLEEQTQTIFRDGNAAARSVFGAEKFVNGAYAPPAMVNAGREFAVAKTSDLSQVGSKAKTQIEAQLELELQLALNPALEGKLQIVNTFEL